MSNEKPTNTPPLDYATPEIPRPWWVKLGLWGVPGRAGAWGFVWLSVAIAGYSLYRAFEEPQWWVGLLTLLSAAAYWAAIRWVDRYGRWK